MNFIKRYQHLSVVSSTSLASLRRFALPTRCGRSLLSLVAILLAAVAFQPPANAASIPYPLNLFTLLQSNADGTAVSPDGGVSVILTGGNNGSGLTGTTDLVTTATEAGTIEFQYTYSSLDDPGFDWAGYLIGDQFTQLADTGGQFGSAAFSVALGDTFGFRVVTFDNTNEPGVFAISDFTAPEPSTLPLVLATALAMAAVRRRRHHHRIMEKKLCDD